MPAQIPARIYKAANCTDCADCLNSAADLWELAGGSLRTMMEQPAYLRRFRALGNRYAVLKTKELAAGVFGMAMKYYEVAQFERQFKALAEIEGRELLIPADVVTPSVALPSASPEVIEERTAKAAALTPANITRQAERAVELLRLISENALGEFQAGPVKNAARLGANVATALRRFESLSAFDPRHLGGLCELARFTIHAAKLINEAGAGWLYCRAAANRLSIAIEYAAAIYRAGEARPGVTPTPPASITTISQQDDEIWSGRSENCPACFIWEDYKMVREDNKKWAARGECSPADFLKYPVAVPYSI